MKIRFEMDKAMSIDLPERMIMVKRKEMWIIFVAKGEIKTNVTHNGHKCAQGLAKGFL